MELINYDRTSGEALGTEIARESPREPGVFFMPAYTTPTAPTPPSAGNVSVYLNADGIPPLDYRDGTWSEKIDRRGPYWRTDNGQPDFLDELGVEPESRGLTALEPVGSVQWDGASWVVDIARASAGALARKDFLLTVATTRIAPLADAVDLGMATPNDVDQLNAWKRYRVDLNRIAQQPGFPESIVWPIAPDAQPAP